MGITGLPYSSVEPVHIDIDNFDSRMKALKPRAAFQVRAYVRPVREIERFTIGASKLS